MPAARQRVVNRGSTDWRRRAYAAISICWKQMSPDGDRDERLAWIAEYLGLRKLDSQTDLTDQQLGAVAGEMKRLTSFASEKAKGKRPNPANIHRANVEDPGWSTGVAGGVVQFPRSSTTPAEAATPPVQEGCFESETIFLASPEQVYTLDKLDRYIGWTSEHRNVYLESRYRCSKFQMLTFQQANKVTTAFLRIAAHADLKKRNPDATVGRVAINKYIPLLKEQLSIDRK